METEKSSQCPICKNEASELLDRRMGDHHFFKCPRCSLYEIAGIFADILARCEADHILSGVIRRANELGQVVDMLTQWNVEELRKRAPATQVGKARQLLEAIQRRAPRPGQVTELRGGTDYPLVYGADASELRFFLNLLVEQGKIKIKETDGRFECEITPNGWESLEASVSPAPELRPHPMSDAAPTPKPSAISSNSGESEDHKKRVEGNATRLREKGVDKVESPTNSPIEVFFSYCHKDDRYRQSIDDHLALLKRKKLISDWHDHKITPGKALDEEIAEHLERARIILLLVSSSFIASDYCYCTELKRAIERHDAGAARVIPIIVRPCDWHSAPFGKLKALPKDGKPVTKWSPQDEAFLDIARGIREVVKELDDVAEPPPRDEAQSSVNPHDDQERSGVSQAQAEEQAWWPGTRSLSREAQKLLVAAAESSTGQIRCANMLDGFFLMAGEFKIGEGTDRRQVARFKAAIRELESLELIEGLSEYVYEVTDSGYQLGDQLEGKGR
jgi:hypothetical protein